MTPAEAATQVALRPAAERDRDFFARVYASTREAEFANAPFTPQQRAALIAQQFAAQSAHYASYESTSFSVVVVGGLAAGRLIVGHWPDREHLVDIALLPEFRGRGVGTALIDGVIAEAERRGVPTTIHVERWNPAQRLYARLGFVAVDAAADAVHRLLERPARPTG